MKAGMSEKFDNQAECSKRAWVLMTLLEEDTGAGARAAVKVHVAKCPSCRVVVTSISNVSEGLAELADSEPDAKLQARADAQLDRALGSGGALTGRVTVPPDEILTAGIDQGRSWWVGYGSLAAAAVILFSIGIYVVGTGSSSGRRSQVTQVLPGAPGSVAEIPLPRDRAPTADAPVQDRPRQDEPMPADKVRVAVLNKPEVAPSRPRGRPAICRHRSHLEAALCPRANSIHSAMIIPRRRPPSP